MRYIFVFIAIGALVGVLVWEVSQSVPTAVIKRHVIELEIARTPEEQQRGLSGREQLAENAGMLFVYERPAIPGFWMPEMNFGLDIIWIDSDKKIVGIAENVLPESYPAIFRPPSLVLYVLEVNAGWSAAHGVATGEEVVLRGAL